MMEDWFCECGHPITVQEEPDQWGGRYIYLDTKTGRIISECPSCQDWPLDVSRLLTEPAPIGLSDEPLQGEIR